MSQRRKDFPEIGILERFFSWKNRSGTFLGRTKRTSPRLSILKGCYVVTYLAKASWSKKPKRLTLARSKVRPSSPDKALQEALHCLNVWFDTSGTFSSWEEIDLYLASLGF